MKLFITSYSDELNHHLATVIPVKDIHNPKFIEIDFFVGCCLMANPEILPEDYKRLLGRMVGTILEISDDCRPNKEGVYLPNEYDLKV